MDGSQISVSDTQPNEYKALKRRPAIAKSPRNPKEYIKKYKSLKIYLKKVRNHKITQNQKVQMKSSKKCNTKIKKG